MVDIVVTPANVRSQVNGIIDNGRAGASILAGQVLAIASDGRMVLADSNVATINTPKGIALHAATTDQPIAFHTAGLINLGATLVAGTAYYLSETPGGIQPTPDLGATENVAQLGLATSTSDLDFRVTAPGVVL